MAASNIAKHIRITHNIMLYVTHYIWCATH